MTTPNHKLIVYQNSLRLGYKKLLGFSNSSFRYNSIQAHIFLIFKIKHPTKMFEYLKNRICASLQIGFQST